MAKITQNNATGFLWLWCTFFTSQNINFWRKSWTSSLNLIWTRSLKNFQTLANPPPRPVTPLTYHRQSFHFWLDFIHVKSGHGEVFVQLAAAINVWFLQTNTQWNCKSFDTVHNTLHWPVNANTHFAQDSETNRYLDFSSISSDDITNFTLKMKTDKQVLVLNLTEYKNAAGWRT